ncbi:hypothetical protein A3Q56_08113 [Intoshia linei]|uniref:Uncharacterized protein n=1 Tax=Intoshia linei TaxID=1819745 RepID=A0A177AQB1_9BILA|nr:hypothetical protein A3Q56_08113 [Intoshia linei]
MNCTNVYLLCHRLSILNLIIKIKLNNLEHRNMPIDMGIEMLKSKFNLYKDQRPKVANKLAVVSKNNFIAKKNIIPNNVRHSGIGIQSNNQHHNQQNKFDQQNIPRNLTKEKASLLFRFLASGKLLHSVDLSSLMNYIDRLIRGNIFDNNSAPLSELTLVEIKEVERERYTKNILGLIKESSPLPPPKKSLLDSHRPMHSDNRLISPRNPRFNMYNESPRHPFQRDQRMYSNINPRKRMYPSAPNYY